MSLYIVPSNETHYHHQRAPYHGPLARCGTSAATFDPFVHHRNAIPPSFFGALLGSTDDDTSEEEDGTLFVDTLGAHIRRHHQQQQHQQQKQQRLLKYQQQVEAEQERRRILHARQSQLQQAQQEQARRERAAAARLIIWEQEQQQQRKTAAALAYQRRRQAAFYEQQQRQAQQEAYLEQMRQAQRRQQQQWARHGLEGIATAQTLFGLMENLLRADESLDDKDKNQVKSSVPAEAPETTSFATISPKSTEAEIKTETAIAMPKDDADGSEEKNSAEEASSSADRLLFTYALPQDEKARSAIKAEDIEVTYDAPSRTIQLNGLWKQDEDGGSTSSTVASEETRGRKRSRSPKRSRVSDVDEKTGEEITQPEEDDEEYVEVKSNVTAPLAATKVTKSIRLPEDASTDGLRAQITDEGFQVWVK